MDDKFPMSRSDRNLLARLGFALSDQKRRLVEFARSLRTLGEKRELKPSIFHRFLMMMDQFEDAKKDELKIINEIEAIEHEHHLRRAKHLLREAQPTTPANDLQKPEEDKPAPKRGFGLLSLLVFLHLMRPKKELNHK